MRDLSNDAIDAAAVLTVCAGSDRQVGLLTKRDADTLGGATPATKLKAEAILDAVEAHFGARPQTVWGAGSMPEHNSLRCLDVMITTLAGGWLGGSKDRATEIGDWVAALVWANRGPWGLRHILWRRRIISTTTSPGVWRALQAGQSQAITRQETRTMSDVQKYRKKPVEIEAMQWDGTAAGATPIIDWALSNGGSVTYRCDGPGGCPGTEGSHYLVIETLEGSMLASPGDFIIRGVANEFYPCKPDIFAATYERVQS